MQERSCPFPSCNLIYADTHAGVTLIPCSLQRLRNSLLCFVQRLRKIKSWEAVEEQWATQTYFLKRLHQLSLVCSPVWNWSFSSSSDQVPHPSILCFSTGCWLQHRNRLSLFIIFFFLPCLLVLFVSLVLFCGVMCFLGSGSYQVWNCWLWLFVVAEKKLLWMLKKKKHKPTLWHLIYVADLSFSVFKHQACLL